MLYWRRILAVVRGCQAPKRISVESEGARKRARLGYNERSCTSGLYSGSGQRSILRRVKHVRVKRQSFVPDRLDLDRYTEKIKIGAA